ncbi:VOC family protein [Arsenicicoccus dermatophilus]|uniref:VOC family protein n=1 Tax=Arsenicicoccus dermatophilus TaxID=1076331 RepID=UPI0038918099
MPSRPVHFEIHVDDLERAKRFYGECFGWQFQDWSEFAGAPYAGCATGPGGASGINGALMQRQGPAPAIDSPVRGAVLTMGVEDFDAVEKRILDGGGQVALAKYALPGMAWQGYYLDTEGNVLGIHQPDPEAR